MFSKRSSFSSELSELTVLFWPRVLFRYWCTSVCLIFVSEQFTSLKCGSFLRPVKTVARITYTVLVETLKPAQSINQCGSFPWLFWILFISLNFTTITRRTQHGPAGRLLSWFFRAHVYATVKYVPRCALTSPWIVSSISLRPTVLVHESQVYCRLHACLRRRREVTVVYFIFVCIVHDPAVSVYSRCKVYTSNKVIATASRSLAGVSAPHCVGFKW